MSTTTKTSKTDLTVSEVIGAMTGYDEDAIAASFGGPIEELDEIQTVRALVFVVERRGENVGDKAALKAAKSLTRREVMGYFTPRDEEPFPDEPVTPVGNG